MTPIQSTEQTEAFARLSAQLKAIGDGALPPGTHQVELVEVAVIQRKRDDQWVLRLIGRTAGDRYVLTSRKLAKGGEDPFALTVSQFGSWDAFTARMGIPGGWQAGERGKGRTVAQGIAWLGDQVGQPFTAKLHRDNTGAIRCSGFTAQSGVVFANDEAALTTDGEVRHSASPPARKVEAHDAHERLVFGIKASHLALSSVAQACHEIHEQQAWSELGYETLSEYLASPEIGMSRSAFYDLCAIWEKYVLEGGADPQALQAGGPSKLVVPIPAIKAGEVTVTEALEDVEALGLRDLREKYQGEKDEKSSRPDKLARLTDDDTLQSAIEAWNTARSRDLPVYEAMRTALAAVKDFLGAKT